MTSSGTLMALPQNALNLTLGYTSPDHLICSYSEQMRILPNEVPNICEEFLLLLVSHALYQDDINKVVRNVREPRAIILTHTHSHQSLHVETVVNLNSRVLTLSTPLIVTSDRLPRFLPLLISNLSIKLLQQQDPRYKAGLSVLLAEKLSHYCVVCVNDGFGQHKIAPEFIECKHHDQ
ncbi:hypothetical protein L1987_08444 [Smallanthus sonchifolius]|uniref:Uncharacterized protein n=1 Tax=Smallanthus sonchifolius TaxID=185202 RepID=A0ACB9JML4_9ASTR|nr:hypothetical protein L1987_08444 [Smallanthus sonchifolius]